MNETFEAVVRATEKIARAEWVTPSAPTLVMSHIVGAVVAGGLTFAIYRFAVARRKRAGRETSHWAVSYGVVVSLLMLLVGLFAGGQIGADLDRSAKLKALGGYSVPVTASVSGGFTLEKPLTGGLVSASKDGIPALGQLPSDGSPGLELIAVNFDIEGFDYGSPTIFVKNTGQDARAALREAFEALDPGHPASEFAGRDGRTDWAPTAKDGK